MLYALRSITTDLYLFRMPFDQEFISQGLEIASGPLNFLPRVLVAIAILLAGWIIGWLVEKASRSLFSALPFFDKLLKEAGLEELTKRAGMRVDIGKFFGVILKVFVIFVFLVASLEVVGLNAVNELFIERVLGYLPNVFSAALILVIGLVVANFLGRLVIGASRAAKIDGGLASKITKWSIVVLALLTALSELGIANEIVQSMIVGVIAAVSLALGLAFGLGGQQAAADVVDRVRNEIEKG